MWEQTQVAPACGSHEPGYPVRPPREPYAAIAGHNMAVICSAHCASCAWHSA